MGNVGVSMKLVVNHLMYRDSPVEVREKVISMRAQRPGIDMVNKTFLSQDKGNG
jgi:hypothetical protein